MLPREELLKGVENREEIAKVIDKAEQAIKTWEVTVTDFLSPAVLAEVERVFRWQKQASLADLSQDLEQALRGVGTIQEELNYNQARNSLSKLVDRLDLTSIEKIGLEGRLIA